MNKFSASSDPRLARYQTIRDQILSRIANGDWPPGQAIPTEIELAQSENVAIGTIRKAVDLLTAEGVLERAQGRGTFVRRPSLDRSFFRFFRMTGAAGSNQIPSAQTLNIRAARCPLDAARVFGLSKNAAALRIDRLRCDGAVPLLIEEIWLPLDRFESLLHRSLDSFGDLLYPLYEKVCSEIVAKADEVLSVEACKARQATYLQLPIGTPVVVIERVARGYDGHAIEWRRSHGAAAKFKYQIEIR